MTSPPFGGPGGGPMRTRKVDPADRAQLEESPVSLRRIGALFAPYRWQITVVCRADRGVVGDLAGQPVPRA
ncbi:hypothetical protein GS474_03845 [Rhodococcus hoagii]|nr:hypothetical protein [Prescottella equi]